MTSELWKEIVHELDADMKKQKRKILLFFDNATSHNILEGCENIKFSFLPPNTTASVQSLDQGIIHCFKLEYRRILVKQQLIAVNSGISTTEFLKTISLLDVLHFVNDGWKNVTQLTIRNCFKKAGFNLYLNGEGTTDDNEEESDEIEYGQRIDWNEYATIDKDIPCHGKLTDEEIVQSLVPNDNENGSNGDFDSDDDADDEPERNTLNEGFFAIEVLKRICIQNNCEEFLPNLTSLEDRFFNLSIKAAPVQTKITTFFKKN
ncbi:tigger transposable element-derived protein 4-like [Teleopsis dalmanni]|uniref:tigger transposable element-derived protein 4-like n=1 Tax=Teleopsis dalmanni TaxID=139649 RepID=UPI0018CE20E2|nr:tigger transposable element-derived protein 4-like [Teleopsis dalmanni]XP_037929104.1 tigger transposable element-derived protein 4-like [Teleopsis dalmanni]XP_037930042.1 tigger transposable element-derived protein 4-like [Teleopsis dalmanni]XP_037944470.1 tigger transposable element-derived protein 4-like [Teleopsis dalmanni]XP_037954898.1 tigger transposable element-derived protein 4-like [Teleopsis dalmanni]